MTNVYMTNLPFITNVPLFNVYMTNVPFITNVPLWLSWPHIFYGHALTFKNHISLRFTTRDNQPRPGTKTIGMSIDLLVNFYLHDPEITTSVSYIIKYTW